MKKLTKVLSMVMLIAMCMSMFAGSAFAAGTCTATTSGGGTCNGIIDATQVPAVAATCTTDGHVAYYKCTNCDACYEDAAGTKRITSDNFIIPKGHKNVVSVPASGSCGSYAVAAHTKCNDCGAVWDSTGAQTTIEALTSDTVSSHVLTIVVPERDATCKDDGNIGYSVCAVCGVKVVTGTDKVVSNVVLPATGNHTYGDWIIDKAATAYNSGTKYRVCSGCGDIETEIIDANGVTVEEADYYLELVGPSYWKSGMDPVTFYSEYYDLNVYTGTLKIDGRSLDRESYWANKNGQLILGDKFMASLAAGKHTAQVVETESRWIESNTVEFYVAATLKPTDTDKHVINSSKSLKFVASDTIKTVKVGGVTLTDSDDFYVNGKNVTLTADFLNKRTAGATYTLTVITQSGEEASCKFQILTTAQASSSPRTGDDSNIALWSAFLLMSGAAVVAVLPRLKKEK